MENSHSNLGKISFTDEMRTLLSQTLSTDFLEIKNAKLNNDFANLLKQLHKLHGAVCYCNLPVLKNTIYNLEQALKSNRDITILFDQFEQEVGQFLCQYSI